MSQSLESRKEEATQVVLREEMTIAEASKAYDVTYESVRQRVRRRKKGINRAARHPSLADVCTTQGIDLADVKGAWNKESKEHSIYIKFDDEDHVRSSLTDGWQELLKEFSKDFPKFKKPKKSKKNNKMALRVTVSDAHVGMDVNTSNGLFQYEYNGEVFSKNMDKVFDACLKEHSIHGIFDEIHLVDLGDGMDGYNGKTTRGGHDLPQNLDTSTAFRVLVRARVKLIKQIAESGLANKIIIQNVGNCNHSGQIGRVASYATQMIIEEVYSKTYVEVDTLNKFMEHREYGDHTFIITHGKDDTQRFRGFPLNLDDRTTNFINEYINHYDIDSKYITVQKGDLHQIGYQRTKRFEYVNYASFAPGSAWVQHNFGDTYSAFTVEVYPKHGSEVSRSHYYLNYQKKK